MITPPNAEVHGSLAYAYWGKHIEVIEEFKTYASSPAIKTISNSPPLSTKAFAPPGAKARSAKPSKS